MLKKLRLRQKNGFLINKAVYTTKRGKSYGFSKYILMIFKRYAQKKFVIRKCR